MIEYTLNDDFSTIASGEFLTVYKEQHEDHQDFFHHPEFQHECFKIYSKGSKCFLLSVFFNGNLIGYMGLRESKITLRRINYNFLVPLGYRVSEYNYPIINKKYFDQFYSVLDKVFNDYNVYFPYTPAFFKIRILKSINHSFINRITDNPIIRSKDEILNLAKGSSIRKRKRQLYNRNNEIEVVHLTNGVSQEIMDSFYNLHIDRWNAEGVNSNFKQKEFRDLYNIIINLKIENVGFPTMSYIKVDGEIQCFQMGYMHKGNTFLAQTRARLLNAKNKSIGSILMSEVLEFCLENDMEIYDTGLGAETYKFLYANDIETYFNIIKFKNSFYRLINRISLK